MVSRAAVEGRRIDAVFRAAAAIQVRKAIEQCLKDGEPARVQIAHLLADKVVRLAAELRRISERGERFVILGLSPLPRRLTLSELGEAGVLAELGALSHGLVYIHDVEHGRIRYARHPLATRLGLPSGSLTLDQVHSKLHPDDAERFHGFLAEQLTASDHKVTKATFRMQGAEAQWLWIEVWSRVLARSADGEPHRIIGVATDITEARLHAAAMAHAAEALDHAELDERRRIGRELHDSTSQFLVAARLGLGALERRGGMTPEAGRLLEEARQAIAGAQAEIRSFSFMLHPPALQTEGLERSLRSFAAGFSRRTGLAISVKVGRGAARLPPHLEVALYRIAQEALMNVYRHAHARKVQVRLKRLDGVAVLEVQDDGVGLACPPDGPGVGVSGMQARMTQIGGEFSIGSARQGVLVRASTPIERQFDA